MVPLDGYPAAPRLDVCAAAGPHAWIITGLVGHTTEHASQIRQFITAAGIAPDM